MLASTDSVRVGSEHRRPVKLGVISDKGLTYNLGTVWLGSPPAKLLESPKNVKKCIIATNAIHCGKVT
jgi:hypothetical protein